MIKQLQTNQLALTQGLNQNTLAITKGFDKMDEVKKWDLLQLPGFEAIEGLKKEEEDGDGDDDDDFVNADDEDKTSASSQSLKKEPKIISFTKEDLNKYLMSKESQEI